MRGWLWAGPLVAWAGCAASEEGPLPERPECPSSAYDPDAMAADVAWLASPELDGRYPGSEGDISARDFIAERFGCLGLASYDGASDYHHAFTDAEGNETGNVFGYVPGEGENAADIIVVSAHVDHFGEGLLGANDDASGLAGLMAIAQSLAEGPAPDRTVLFAAFGAEEEGFEGSDYFFEQPPEGVDPNDSVYNVNMDMIGSYDSTGLVNALGTFGGTQGRAVVDAVAGDYPELDVSVGDSSNSSDNVSFCSRGIGYVFMWTEDLECYHQLCDTADVVDYPHMVQIAELTGDIAGSLANSEDDLRAAVTPDSDVCE